MYSRKWNFLRTKLKLGSVHYFLRIKKSEQCSDLGGWVVHGKMGVQCFFIVNAHIFGVDGWLTTNPNIVQIFKSVGNNGYAVLHF